MGRITKAKVLDYIKSKEYTKYLRPYHPIHITFTRKKKHVDIFDKWSDFPVIHRIVQRGSVCYRTLWALALILCWMLSCYQVWDRITFYLSEPTWTSVKMVRSNNLLFPSITGCIDTTSTKEILRVRNDFTSRQRVNPCDYRHLHFYALDELGLYRELNYTGLTRTALLGKDLISSCGILLNQGTQVNGDSSCTNTPHVDSLLACVTTSYRRFPLSDMRTPRILGWESTSDHCRKLSDVNSLLVLIHEPMYDNMLVHWKIEQDEDSIEYKYKNDTPDIIFLSATEYSYLNTLANPCTDNKTYLSCFHKFVNTIVKNSKLKCSLPEYGPPHLQMCQNVSDGFAAFKELHENLRKKKIPCPRRCQETIYRRTTERTVYQTGRFSVTVKFSDDIVTLSQESYVYGLVSLLCDIGGNIGLFLGISLISVFEIIEICYHRCVYPLMRKNVNIVCCL